MPAEVEEDCPLPFICPGVKGLANRSGNRVVRLRRGNDALSARKLNAGGKGI
jgi:hypothetical protein